MLADSLHTQPHLDRGKIQTAESANDAQAENPFVEGGTRAKLFNILLDGQWHSIPTIQEQYRWDVTNRVGRLQHHGAKSGRWKIEQEGDKVRMKWSAGIAPSLELALDSFSSTPSSSHLFAYATLKVAPLAERLKLAAQPSSRTLAIPSRVLPRKPTLQVFDHTSGTPAYKPTGLCSGLHRHGRGRSGTWNTRKQLFPRCS